MPEPKQQSKPALERVYAFPELAPYTGKKSKPTIYRWVREGTFPEPIRLGENTAVWREADLIGWQQKALANQGVQRTTSVAAANTARRATAAQRRSKARGAK